MRKILKKVNLLRLAAVVIVGFLVGHILNNYQSIDNDYGIHFNWKEIKNDLENEFIDAYNDANTFNIYSLLDIKYSGIQVEEINNNTPVFEEKEIQFAKENGPYEQYSKKDLFGRCGSAIAYIDKNMMPTAERESIGTIKPTGWHTYNTKEKWNVILPTSNFYLYNRCHLIAYCLTGENANENNLITGTDQMNQAMLPYEIQIAQYVETHDTPVLYKVTPVFSSVDLLARGVLIQAMTIENNDISFCVYIHNAQDGFEIDYSSGEATYKGE